MHRYTVCSLRHRPRSENSFVVMTKGTTHGYEFLFKPDGTGVISTTIPIFGKIYTTNDQSSFKWDPSTFPITALLKDMADGNQTTILHDGLSVFYPPEDAAIVTGCDLTNITQQITHHHIKNSKYIMYASDLYSVPQCVRITEDTNIEEMVVKLLPVISNVFVRRNTTGISTLADFDLCFGDKGISWLDFISFLS